MRVLKPRTEPRSKRKKIEEKGSLSLGGERDHLAFLLFGGLLVDVLQVRGLAAKARTVINDLAVNLAGCEVDETQDSPQMSDILHLTSTRKLCAGIGLAVR